MIDALEIARELDAIAGIGLTYTRDRFDIERYTRLREIAAEMLAAGSNLTPGDIHVWQKEEFGYATPKVDVRAFICREGKALLVREDADGGKWTLPGGWADVNDSPSESCVREVEEESGYIVEVKQLLAVLDREKQGHPPPYPYHIYKMYFLCEIVGGQPKATLECSESAFFERDELPELSESRVLARHIERFFDMVETTETRTWFD